jgi:hypothetical protein
MTPAVTSHAEDQNTTRTGRHALCRLAFAARLINAYKGLIAPRTGQASMRMDDRPMQADEASSDIDRIACVDSTDQGEALSQQGGCHAAATVQALVEAPSR